MTMPKEARKVGRGLKASLVTRGIAILKKAHRRVRLRVYVNHRHGEGQAASAHPL